MCKVSVCCPQTLSDTPSADRAHSSYLHYRVQFLHNDQLTVVEHFRVAPMVIRVRLSELEVPAGRSVNQPIKLGEWVDQEMSQDMLPADRFGGAIPVCWHPDSKHVYATACLSPRAALCMWVHTIGFVGS